MKKYIYEAANKETLLATREKGISSESFVLAELLKFSKSPIQDINYFKPRNSETLISFPKNPLLDIKKPIPKEIKNWVNNQGKKFIDLNKYRSSGSKNPDLRITVIGEKWKEFIKGDILDIEVESSQIHYHRRAIDKFYFNDILFDYLNDKPVDNKLVESELNSKKREFLTAFGIVSRYPNILLYAKVENSQIHYFTLDNSNKLFNGKFKVFPPKKIFFVVPNHDKPLFELFVSFNALKFKRDTTMTKELTEVLKIFVSEIKYKIHEDIEYGFPATIKFLDTLSPEYINSGAKSSSQSFKIPKGTEIKFKLVISKKESKEAKEKIKI